MRRHLAGLALPLLVIACAGEPTVEGTRWRLVTLSGAPPQGEQAITLLLDEGQASGSSGCNTYTATYSLDGLALRIGPVAGTRMACPDSLMKQENLVLWSLRNAERIELTGDKRLHLRAGEQELLFEAD